jgi:chromate reductase
VLRTAAQVASATTEVEIYDAMVSLPHFNPDDDPDGGPIDPAVADLRAAIDGADAMLICTPEYAGALPGALKNLLEWTIGGAQTYDKPIAWINASGQAAPTGGADAHDSLRKVLTYAGADIVEEACARIPVARDTVSDDGCIVDREIRDEIANVLAALCSHVSVRRERETENA